VRLCRVTGDVVSTVKNEHLAGQRILVCQPVDLDKTTPLGTSFLALDATHSCGVSDLVLTIKEGGGVRIVFENKSIPLASIIVAAVDELHITDEASLVGTSLLEHTLQGDQA
jgi:microcompartment protein CcmK/EutM